MGRCRPYDRRWGGLGSVWTAVLGRSPLSSSSTLTQLALGPYGEILRTSDGFNSFTGENSGAYTGLHGMSFVDANSGWAVGGAGTIVHTATGGSADTLPPVTLQTGADEAWRDSGCTVTLSASDPNWPNSFGVDYTEYSIDGGPWTEGDSLTLTAQLITATIFSTRFCIAHAIGETTSRRRRPATSRSIRRRR